MAYLGFNDGSGYVTLRGVMPAPLNRFRNFSPTTQPVGPSVTSLGAGSRSLWRYRTDYLVSLELPFISPRTYSGESGTRRAQRFITHILQGGAVDCAPEDDVSTALTTSWIAEGATASLVLDNAQDMLYSLSMTLYNSTAPFVAVYGGLRP